MKKQIIITLTFLLCLVAAWAQTGTITNIRVSQGPDTDLRLVDILFNLSGSDATYDITLEVSFDDGSNYVAINNTNVTGNLTVAPASDIHLEWDGRSSHSGQSSDFSRIKITATTHVPAIGEFFLGGIVFYLDGSGGGLICAITDQDGGSGIQWYNGSYTTTGATGIAIGTGQANTTAIINNQGAGSYAATVCTDEGAGWFLPSRAELNQMFLNKAAIEATATANGGTAFVSTTYWSSSEYYNYYAFRLYFINGYDPYDDKSLTSGVRAVRAF